MQPAPRSASRGTTRCRTGSGDQVFDSPPGPRSAAGIGVIPRALTRYRQIETFAGWSRRRAQSRRPRRTRSARMPARSGSGLRSPWNLKGLAEGGRRPAAGFPFGSHQGGGLPGANVPWISQLESGASLAATVVVAAPSRRRVPLDLFTVHPWITLEALLPAPRRRFSVSCAIRGLSKPATATHLKIPSSISSLACLLQRLGHQAPRFRA
jgi:hypothetical protein